MWARRRALSSLDSVTKPRHNAQVMTFPFEAIHNFRDFGGYATPEGRVKRGLLFRSAHYAEATDADLEAFRALGMTAIVDLRRPAERTRFATRRHPECGARLIAYGEPAPETEAPHLSYLHEDGVTEATISARMTEVYRELPYEDGHLEVFGKAFAALPDLDGPIVMHCHAGKDRTGLIVAFIQHALGVGEADILTDYLATNTKSRIDERLPHLIRTFRDNHGLEAPAHLMRHIWKVEKGYLDAALDEIAARDGSLDGYLEKRLGVTPAMRAALKARLVESA